MGIAQVAGWHGKLPALGDFASRRLDAGFVEPWDAWLSHGLARLRQQPGWPGAYLASPSWRFVLLPGVLPGAAGEGCWAGVLMPSVDRVGRYYPLTIALALPGLPHAAMLLARQAATAWLERSRGLAFWSGQPDDAAARVLCSQGLERDRLVESLFGAAADNPA